MKKKMISFMTAAAMVMSMFSSSQVLADEKADTEAAVEYVYEDNTEEPESLSDPDIEGESAVPAVPADTEAEGESAVPADTEAEGESADPADPTDPADPVYPDDTAEEIIPEDPEYEDDHFSSYMNSYIPADKEMYVVDPSSMRILDGEEIPSRYRSDEQPWAANIQIRDQMNSGICWAFSMSTSAEYSYAKELYEQTGEIYGGELSPGHIARFLYDRVIDPLDNTQGDYTEITPNDHFSVFGGNAIYGMQHLASWSGIVPESEAPFEEITDHIINDKWDGSASPYSADLAYGHNEMTLEESVYIKNPAPEVMKQLILKYGACSVSVDFNSKYMNLNEINEDTGEAYPEGRSFYNDSSRFSPNHEPALIGWDDTYPKENFRREKKVLRRDEDGFIVYEGDSLVYDIETIMPENDGAWIIQNSWGDYSHDNGVFYASYESVDFNSSKCRLIAFDMQSADTYDYNFLYDGSCYNLDTLTIEKEFGDAFPFQTTPGTYAANIYTNTTGHPVSLEAVGYTEYNYGFTPYDVSVYTGLSDPNDPMSGTLRGTTLISSTTPGCKTGMLDEPVVIKPGETYSIVFQFSESTAFGFETDYYSNALIYYYAQTAPRQSFFKTDENSSWTDINDYKSCFRIKGFANACEFDLTGANVVLSDTKYTFNNNVQRPEILSVAGLQLTEGIDYTAEWSDAESKNPGVYSVTIHGIGDYTGTTEGTYQIAKAANPMTVTARNVSAGYSTLQKKDLTIAASSVFTINNNQGRISYKKASGDPKILISSVGKITLKKGIKAGTYTFKTNVTAAGNSNYKPVTRTVAVKITVRKAANPMTVTAKNISAGYNTLQKKDLTFAASSVFTINNNQGRISYQKASGDPKILISSVGKITLKKGIKAGTYTFKANVTAAGNSNYRPVTKTVSLTITVK